MRPSFACAAMGNRQLFWTFSRFDAQGFQPFVTFVHLRGIFSVNSANTQRSRRFKAFRTAGSAEKCLVWPNRINSIAALIECPIWLVG
jgi:hypothetical protein